MIPVGTIRWLSAGLDEVPDDDEWVDAAMGARFAGMRFTKRFSEARLARWTAKRTIAAALGLPHDTAGLRQIVVRNAPDGAPVAYVGAEPISAVIAMTDRADWSVCAIRDGEGRVGCDLELVEPRTPAFVADYFTEAEQIAVARAADRDVVANLIWSAKESALKVLRTGLRQDTRTVEVNLHGEDGADWEVLTVTADGGTSFPGWWRRFGDFLLTFVAEAPTSAPVALDDPPRLASAEPSHRWMEQLRR